MKRLPIKFRMPKSLRMWAKGSTWRELLMTVLATTISIVLTFGTAGLLERCQRTQDRRMSAMMVMSNIENFSRNLDRMSTQMARRDSICTWMLSLPKDSLDLIPPAEIANLLNEVIAIDLLSHDKTAESIFGNNIETWKNMGNFQFIDNVGVCFSKMNNEEKYWNSWVEDFEKVVYDVIEHPDQHPGKHTFTKLLNNDVFRERIESFRTRQAYMEYLSHYFRYLNRKNMMLIGIKEQDVLAFTDNRDSEIKLQESEPMQADFRREQLNRDSLTTLRPFIEHIDSVMHGR